jgi:hypothetical protein
MRPPCSMGGAHRSPSSLEMLDLIATR